MRAARRGEASLLKNTAPVELLEVKGLGLARGLHGSSASQELGLETAGNDVGLAMGVDAKEDEAEETGVGDLKAGEVEVLVDASRAQEREKGEVGSVIELQKSLLAR